MPAACCGVAGLKTTFRLISIKGVHPISPNYLDTVGPMAKDVDGLVKGMELLQEDFHTLYDKAKAAKPSARQIRIGRLRVPGTDPAIDRAIDARLAERGFQVVPLGDEFFKKWKQAQRDGNLVAAAASWYNESSLSTPRRRRLAGPASDLVRKISSFPGNTKTKPSVSRRSRVGMRGGSPCKRSFTRSMP